MEVIFETSELLNYSDAVKLLNISRPTLYTWIAKGKLHPLAVGRNRFLMRSEILALCGQEVGNVR